MSSTLRGSDSPLSHRYDVAMLDLDGVVYVGPDAVPGVPAALRQARRDGMRLAFVTNNASRPPAAVAAHLTELGIDAAQEEVVTSAQAAARYLAERLPSGASVLVVGASGLTEALREQGLAPVDAASSEVVAVVQGFSQRMDWALLAEGAVAINRKALWVATNVDPTVPSPRGPLPGNGSLVRALSHATRQEPIVTGKPDPTMHRETLIRTGAQTPLVVGDRLDTDIEGASAVDCDSVIVFSGVTTVSELIAARSEHRPTYIGQDLSTILDIHPPVEVATNSARCGRWTAQWDGARLILSGGGGRSESFGKSESTGTSESFGKSEQGTALDGSGFDGEQLDAIRALCAAAWEAGETSIGEVSVSGADAQAAKLIESLGIDEG